MQAVTGMAATNSFSGKGAVLHASPVPPLPAPGGRRYVALCGETVTNVTSVPWSPVGGVRCPGCTAQIMRVNALMEMRGFGTLELDA